jgi:hypothetical protein
MPQLLIADPELLLQPDRLKANMRGMAQVGAGAPYGAPRSGVWRACGRGEEEARWLQSRASQGGAGVSTVPAARSPCPTCGASPRPQLREVAFAITPRLQLVCCSCCSLGVIGCY